MTFLREPSERPYGIEALFRDGYGDWFSLTQPEVDRIAARGQGR